MSKDKLERCTLWVLALGLLITVSFNVAKSVVRDYQDLRQELHRPGATQTTRGAAHGRYAPAAQNKAALSTLSPGPADRSRARSARELRRNELVTGASVSGNAQLQVTVNRFTEFPGQPCGDPCVKKT
jgi:hypothetical protein